jgi:hypothetical protein
MTLTHTSNEDTEQSTIEASITFDGVTLTDSLIEWSLKDWPSVCREIPQCLPIRCSGRLITLQNEHSVFVYINIFTVSISCFTVYQGVTGVVQSVERLATGWKSEGSELESRKGQEFSFRHIVQTGSGVHPESYPKRNVTFFPGCKAVGAWSWPLTST